MEEGQLALLVLTLKSQIVLTSERITQLQAVANTLLKPDEQDSQEVPQTPEISSTKQLEQRRLQLLMDVQKHDYVGDKLMVLINQNEELLAYLKLFLMEPKVDYSEDNSNYVTSKINATSETLQSLIDDSRANQSRVAAKLSDLNNSLLDMLDTAIRARSVKGTGTGTASATTNSSSTTTTTTTTENDVS